MEQFHFIIVIMTLVYLGFAIWFILVMRSNPLEINQKYPSNIY